MSDYGPDNWEPERDSDNAYTPTATTEHVCDTKETAPIMKQRAVDLNKVVCVIRGADGKERDYVKPKRFANPFDSHGYDWSVKPPFTSIDQVSFGEVETHVHAAEVCGTVKGAQGWDRPKPAKVDTYYVHKGFDGKKSWRRITHDHHLEVALEELFASLEAGKDCNEIDFYVIKKGSSPSAITLKDD